MFSQDKKALTKIKVGNMPTTTGVPIQYAFEKGYFKDEGLDVAHVGFAVWQEKNLHLLHASRKEGAVVISKKTLVAYLKSNKIFTGIIVARFSHHF
jgi:hypothetical protein